MKKVLLVVLSFIFVLSGCGRDTSSPEKVLLGHWENEYYDIYYSSDKLISVLKDDADPGLKEALKKEGIAKTSEVKYNILSSDKKDRSILMKPVLDVEGVSIFATEIRFNEDYTKATSTINLKESDLTEEDEVKFKNVNQEYMDTQTTEMKYIDSKQKPE